MLATPFVTFFATYAMRSQPYVISPRATIRINFLIKPGVPHFVEFIIVLDNSSGICGIGAPALVPEPETYAMLLASPGVLRFIARRRKQSAS